jgi:hypothetical protein
MSQKLFTLISLFLLLSQSAGAASDKRIRPEFPYRSLLSLQAPERHLPIQATRRILKERERFLGLTSYTYSIEANNIRPYKGKIEAAHPGYVLIVIGYHYLEKPWGRIFRREFQRNVSDPQNRIRFLEIKNNDILTGDDSPASNHEIRDYLHTFPGKVVLVIEVHEHLSDASQFYGNEWPPYWYQLDNRTGGDHSIKYTILDPYIPWFCIRDYFEGKHRIRLSEMQKAVNETIQYTVDIINEVLAQ